MTLVYLDQGYTGEIAKQSVEEHGVDLEVVKHPEAKRGFVLWLIRWVVKRSFAWATCFRRLARDYERLVQTFAGFHYLVFTCLTLQELNPLISTS